MKLEDKVRLLACMPLEFRCEDLADKYRIDLYVGEKKVKGGFIMKGEKSNTTEIELRESLLLDYCSDHHYAHLV